MRVHLCGVRGSTPAPGPEFVRYGGHTSCVALTPDDHGDSTVPTLVLDAGTGLRRVTPLLGGRPFVGAILLTHLHWDHMQGLPFFAGGGRDDARVTLLLPASPERTKQGDRTDTEEAEAVLARAMSPPFFPIRPRELRGEWAFGTLSPGRLDPARLDLGAFSVEAKTVPHTGGPTLGFRVSDGRTTIAYIPDHCPTVLGPGPDGWGEYHPAALELADGVDILVHDAHLLPSELAAEARYGHAAADYAVGLGQQAGARQVVLFHHRPDRTDDDIDELARRLRAAPTSITITMAVEGSVLAP